MESRKRKRNTKKEEEEIFKGYSLPDRYLVDIRNGAGQYFRKDRKPKGNLAVYNRLFTTFSFDKGEYVMKMVMQMRVVEYDDEGRFLINTIRTLKNQTSELERIAKVFSQHLALYLHGRSRSSSEDLMKRVIEAVIDTSTTNNLTQFILLALGLYGHDRQLIVEVLKLHSKDNVMQTVNVSKKTAHSFLPELSDGANDILNVFVAMLGRLAVTFVVSMSTYVAGRTTKFAKRLPVIKRDRMPVLCERFMSCTRAMTEYYRVVPLLNDAALQLITNEAGADSADFMFNATAKSERRFDFAVQSLEDRLHRQVDFSSLPTAMSELVLKTSRKPPLSENQFIEKRLRESLFKFMNKIKETDPPMADGVARFNVVAGWENYHGPPPTNVKNLYKVHREAGGSEVISHHFGGIYPEKETEEDSEDDEEEVAERVEEPVAGPSRISEPVKRRVVRRIVSSDSDEDDGGNEDGGENEDDGGNEVEAGTDDDGATEDDVGTENDAEVDDRDEERTGTGDGDLEHVEEEDEDEEETLHATPKRARVDLSEPGDLEHVEEEDEDEEETLHATPKRARIDLSEPEPEPEPESITNIKHCDCDTNKLIKLLLILLLTLTKCTNFVQDV